MNVISLVTIKENFFLPVLVDLTKVCMVIPGSNFLGQECFTGVYVLYVGEIFPKRERERRKERSRKYWLSKNLCPRYNASDRNLRTRVH